jgi:hypothetical protein
VRIVTWNVNSLRVRLPRVLELLAEYRPDVVGWPTGCAPAASTASTVRGPSHPIMRRCCSISPARATDETPQRFFSNVYAVARSLTPWRAFS